MAMMKILRIYDNIIDYNNHDITGAGCVCMGTLRNNRNGTFWICYNLVVGSRRVPVWIR